MDEYQSLKDVIARWEKKGRGPAEGGSSGGANMYSRRPLSTRLPRRPSGNHRQPFNRRRQRRLSAEAAIHQSSFAPSLGIDPGDLHAATMKKYTSISRCCEKCVPLSKAKFLPDPSRGEGVGLQNVLLVDKRKYSRFPGRLFPYALHMYNTEVNYRLLDHRKSTLESKRIKDAVEFCADTAMESTHDGEEASTDYDRVVSEQVDRTKTIVNGMSAGVSTGVVKTVGWLLFWVFSRLFNRIDVQKKHVLMLRNAQERGLPMVFLPCHKSHMDYIIMTFVLFNLGVKVPRIAAGDNLKLPIVSWLVTHLGGFFIKRRLDHQGRKDVLYRKCLHEYMEQALRSGENMEFFIEGSRTRSGKPALPPKAGLLSVLVDSVRDGVVEDILIVPVSISYDKLLERGFVRHELMGRAKNPETFMEAVRGLWSLLTQNIGGVRVDFSQPFSVQEFLSSATVSSNSFIEMSTIARSHSMVNLSDVAFRKLVTALSYHIVYDVSHCGSFTPTSMVSFLLLNKHNKGVQLSELVDSYEWLQGMATTRGRSVTFTGSPREAVCYALHYLGPLVQTEGKKRKDGMPDHSKQLSPCVSLPEVFDLMHHANQVSSLFALEAVVACSILSLVSDEVGHIPENEPLQIYRDELIEEAMFLCQLFTREFVLTPPCVDVWNALLDTVTTMINSETLKIQTTPSAVLPGGRRLPKPIQDSDEEENIEATLLHVSKKRDVLEQMQFLRSVLDPLLDAYWMTATALLKSAERDTEESEFLHSLQESLVQKAQRGLLNRVDSCSMETLKNALKRFTDMDLVSVKEDSVLHVKDTSRLLEVAESIDQFRS